MEQTKRDIQGASVAKCLRCKTEFRVVLSRLLNGRGKYCSRVCKNISSIGIRYSPATEIKKGQRLSKKTEFKKGCVPVADRKLPTAEKHHLWKGDEVSYGVLHRWVYRHKGKPILCEHCSGNKTMNWANKSKEYKRELSDWIALCKKCHAKYDKKN